MFLHFSFKDNPAQSNNDCHYLTDLQFITRFAIRGQYLLLTRRCGFQSEEALALFPQPGIGSACDIFGFCTAFCQLPGPMGAVAQKYPGLLAVGFRPIRDPDQQTSMHRQASRNLGPTSEFPRIAEKEAGAKLHLGSICILLAV